jgi:hypothetical protein
MSNLRCRSSINALVAFAQLIAVAEISLVTLRIIQIIEIIALALAEIVVQIVLIPFRVLQTENREKRK